MADNNVRAADSRNLTVIEGASFWLRTKGSTDPADWREVGSVMDVEFDPSETRIEHFSNRRGARVKDREIITERKLGVNFTLEEINLHNLAYAFGDSEPAEAATKTMHEGKIYTNPGSTGVIELGQDDVHDVIVRSPALDGAEVTYVENTDYTVNEADGEVTILAAALGDPGTVEEIHISYEKDVLGQKFQLFPGSEIAVEAMFQALGNGGPKQIFEIPSAIIKQNGSIKFGNGGEWQSIPMRLEALGGSSGALGEGFIANEDEIL